MLCSNYSFQLHPDTRTTVSLGVAGITTVALLVTLVTLTYFQHLPPFTHCIAGGGSAASLLIGSLVATCRRKNAQISPSKELGTNVPITLGLSASHEETANMIPVAPPPIMDVLDQVTYVTVSPNANKCLPPSKVWPFTTAQFSFTLSVGNKQFNYDLLITEFKEIEGKVHACFVHNGKIHSMVVNEESGREYIKDSVSWTLSTEKISPRATLLNAKIQLEGYLSAFHAWYRLGHLLNENKAGWFFFTNSAETNAVFKVPGLQSVSYKGSVVTFTRNTSHPLIHLDQIELLKKSSHPTVLKIGDQLDNPVWHYDAKQPILSVTSEGDRVFIQFEKTKNTVNDSF